MRGLGYGAEHRPLLRARPEPGHPAALYGPERPAGGAGAEAPGRQRKEVELPAAQAWGSSATSGPRRQDCTSGRPPARLYPERGHGLLGDKGTGVKGGVRLYFPACCWAAALHKCIKCSKVRLPTRLA